MPKYRFASRSAVVPVGVSVSVPSTDRRPDELSPLRPLGEQAQPAAVPVQALQVMTSLRTVAAYASGAAARSSRRGGAGPLLHPKDVSDARVARWRRTHPWRLLALYALRPPHCLPFRIVWYGQAMTAHRRTPPGRPSAAVFMSMAGRVELVAWLGNYDVHSTMVVDRECSALLVSLPISTTCPACLAAGHSLVSNSRYEKRPSRMGSAV